VNRQHRIKKVRKPDAMRFSRQAKERAVAVKAPGAALFDEFEARLVVTVEDFVGYAAIWAAVD
jgi:hypothetical protein